MNVADDPALGFEQPVRVEVAQAARQRVECRTESRGAQVYGDVASHRDHHQGCQPAGLDRVSGKAAQRQRAKQRRPDANVVGMLGDSSAVRERQSRSGQ